MNGLNVFISHHHEEKLLAKAWHELLSTLTLGKVLPWYSSDERASGGIGPGEWRQEIRERLEEAGIILVLITPVSNEKPWLFFESGFASGQKKEIIPVFYYTKAEDINSVFRALQCYQGDRLDGSTGMVALCEKLMRMHLGIEIPEPAKTPWMGWLGQYMGEVQKEREQSHTRNLFQEHFHNHDSAVAMEGQWFAKWTQLHGDGTEDVFEVDELAIWTTEGRLRIVGTSEKQGRDMLSEKGQVSARYYPMEGVVSKLGWVALSYWSGGKIPICGTALLAPVGSTGEVLEGTWQGFTAKDINDKPALTNGRVVMARNKKRVVEFWPELPHFERPH